MALITFEIQGRGLYRYDSVSYASQAIGQDVVTLLVAGLILARKGSLHGRLLPVGTLFFFLYTSRSWIWG